MKWGDNMTKEKLERAREVLEKIEFAEKQLRQVETLSNKPLNNGKILLTWGGSGATVPRELELPITSMLESHYRKELEKAKKEFEEM